MSSDAAGRLILAMLADHSCSNLPPSAKARVRVAITSSLFSATVPELVWVMSWAFPSSWPGHHLIDDHRTRGRDCFLDRCAPCLANENVMRSEQLR